MADRLYIEAQDFEETLLIKSILDKMGFEASRYHYIPEDHGKNYYKIILKDRIHKDEQILTYWCRKDDFISEGEAGSETVKNLAKLKFEIKKFKKYGN